MKDYFGYKDKVCVVTGAASGMGKSCTEILVDMGAKVYAMDRNEITVPGTAKNITVDLLSKESIDNAFAQIPDVIDSFFGIAGITGVHNTMTEVMMVNYGANKYMVEEYLEKRVPEETGTIGFITSSAGTGWEEPEHVELYIDCIKDADGNLYQGWEATWNACYALEERYNHPDYMHSCYGVSKMAMNYYFALIAPKFGKRHIRVNAVLPMGTSTALTPEFEAMSPHIPSEKRMQYNGWAGRWAHAHEQAGPLVFLNSEMASFLSGIMLYGDYGYELQFLSRFVPRRINTKIKDYKG